MGVNDGEGRREGRLQRGEMEGQMEVELKG